MVAHAILQFTSLKRHVSKTYNLCMRVEETVACNAHNLMLGAGVSTIQARKSKCTMRTRGGGTDLERGYGDVRP